VLFYFILFYFILFYLFYFILTWETEICIDLRLSVLEVIFQNVVLTVFTVSISAIKMLLNVGPMTRD